MCELLVDTDVLMKLAAYGLYEVALHPNCMPDCNGRTGLIDAAQYVARKRLPAKASDATRALSYLESFIAAMVMLQPTDAELALAADFEAAAATLGVDLDTGESQLCAMAMCRGAPIILTGDKRAISAAEALLDKVNGISGLTGHLACLEQAMNLALDRYGVAVVRDRIVAEPRIDRALNICFSVSAAEAPDAALASEGLRSYLDDLRSRAPRLLLSGDFLTT